MLAVGDFDSDGYEDLAIGMWGEDAPPFGSPESGQVLILHGSPAGLLAVGNEVWQQEASGVAENPDGDDRFGFSLVVADFDGSGTDDRAIGAPGESNSIFPGPNPESFRDQVGAVHVLYSDEDGLTVSGQDFWLQRDLIGVGAFSEEDFFAWELAPGDFDNDGYDAGRGRSLRQH